MKVKTAKVCMKALMSARSIQSLHLTSPAIDKLSKAADKIFRHCLFNLMDNDPCAEEIPSDWNAHFRVPNLETDEITSNIASSIMGVNQRENFVRQQGTSTKNFEEQRLVFSRLMGRKDLTHNHSWLRYDELDTFGRPCDIRDELNAEMQSEV